MSFIQRIERNAQQTPHRVVLADERGEYSNSQLWQLSGRVYGYLQQRHTAREDVVLVHLPRGAEAVMAMIGVFRAGAAVVMLEDYGPNDFVEFVKREVRPCLTIDGEAMAAIRQLAPAEGYREAGLHDLAYIAYTTGSTGLRKGVMHEYGTMEETLKRVDVGQQIWNIADDRHALVATLHSMQLYFGMLLAQNACIDIVPLKVYHDPTLFHRYLCERHIQCVVLGCGYLKEHGIEVVQTPYMKYIEMSFEPANAIYSDKTLLYNEYGMTETGWNVSEFHVDRLYDLVPIGKPIVGVRMEIRDEEDRPVADGVLGEICVESRYCRGYLNRPELTAAQFHGGMYHTRDLGMRQPDGNYIMYGRMCDALRTRHGMVIALEVEIEARKALGRNSAYVKLFATEEEPIICLYTDFDIDFAELQAALGKVLPAYKVPTDYIRVPRFETSNGKVVRVGLQNPRR